MHVNIYKYMHMGVHTGETLVFSDYDKTGAPAVVVDVPEGSTAYVRTITFPGGGQMYTEELIKHAVAGEFGLSIVEPKS